MPQSGEEHSKESIVCGTVVLTKGLAPAARRTLTRAACASAGLLMALREEAVSRGLYRWNKYLPGHSDGRIVALKVDLTVQANAELGSAFQSLVHQRRRYSLLQANGHTMQHAPHLPRLLILLIQLLRSLDRVLEEDLAQNVAVSLRSDRALDVDGEH